MLETSFVRRERNVDCRQREMWLKAGGQMCWNNIALYKNTYNGSVQIRAFLRFCFRTGIFKMLKFLRQNVKKIWSSDFAYGW